MSTVNGTSNNGGTTGSDSDLPRAAVNLSEATQLENSFISLMVAQIKYQDPTNPVDSTEFLNQYSAMSQVKSMENMTQLSQNNLVLMDNLQTLTAAGLVGQEVKVRVDRLQLDEQPIDGQIQLEFASAKTVLQLTDANGQKTEIQLGPQVAGSVDFRIDPKALGLRPGAYQVAVTTESGETPQVEVAGLVGKVRVSADGPVLEVEGVGSVPFYNIVEFGPA
ncbi:flagellar hook capping FlgD N-terminal domain-containing protein [Metapseudomonas resinovorans]|uniref:Basal-body rod modification protein FlgD n=1 Tax=Metapseudomonas resinovorans NBRC 106553 TaxID=1245471 RepID=S6AYN9_METRE|nr:flagellar hook capping FlgD N-terminal domain-containing protein [Pseudomonas resinovorans]BAN49921.1 flagellar basal body rod modification protein [Pseudomonas resinovorans NBRC 106553]